MEKDDVIKDRCIIIAKIINAIKEIYKFSNMNQKAFIQTIIGAGIWYIPKPKNCWSGKISVKLLDELISNKNGKISEEHIIPRKAAAKELLEDNNILELEYVENIFREKYSKLHYITPEENKKAIKYQKTDVFENPEKVYKQAKIEFIEINSQILKDLREGRIINKEELLKKMSDDHNCT